MSATDQPSEQELRAAYEAELKKIRVEHVLLEQVVTLVNLGMRRTGMAPGTEDERDPEQVQMAIEGVRAVMPLVERAAPEQAQPIRDALSQLQLAYVRLGGAAEPAQPGSAGPGSAGPGSAGAGSVPAPGARPGQTPPPTPGADPGQTPAAPPAEEPSEPQAPGEPGPAQRSGRLWVPGQ
jgi:hypothetical protein